MDRIEEIAETRKKEAEARREDEEAPDSTASKVIFLQTDFKLDGLGPKRAVHFRSKDRSLWLKWPSTLTH